MSNIKSQIKRNVQNKKTNIQNRKKRVQVRTALKTAKLSKNVKDINLAVKKVDSMAAKRIISKNKAAREKSRLMKLAKTSK